MRRQKGDCMRKWDKKKIIIVSLAVLGTAVLGAGCGKQQAAGGNAQETIEFWTISLQPTFNDYFETLFSEFEKENPGVTVEWKDYPKDTIQEKLLTAIASGNAPDVVNVNADMALTLGKKNALANAEEYISDEVKDSFFEGIYEAARVDGAMTALPWYTTIPVIYINEALLEEAGIPTDNYPSTTEEFYNWAIDITEKTGLYGTAMEANIREILGSAGLPVFNGDYTELVINTPEAVKVIQQFQKLYDTEANPKENLDQEARAQLYSSKQVVSVYSGTTFVNKFKTTAPDVYENTAVIPVPFKSNVSTTMYLSVPQESKNREQAFKFAEYVANAKKEAENLRQRASLAFLRRPIRCRLQRQQWKIHFSRRAMAVWKQRLSCQR